MPKPGGPPIVWWMDAQDYQKLSKEQKNQIAAAINAYNAQDAIDQETLRVIIVNITG